MSERYVVEDGSASGHCCFGATVIDTTRKYPAQVCECFDPDDAALIAAALNDLTRPATPASRS